MPALTIAEAQKLDQNDFQAGVNETLITRSPILEMLPFVNTTGVNFEFNREKTRGSAVWADPDEVVGTEASTFDNVTVAMRRLYRVVEIPMPLQVGLSTLQDQTRVQITEATLAMRDEFLDAFYYGDQSDDTKVPDGTHELIKDITVPSGATLPRVERGTGGAGQALRLQDLDNMLYSLMKRGVDLISMNSAIFRLLQTGVRSTSVGGTINFTPDTFGQPAIAYNGVRMAVDDALRTTENVSGTSYDAPTGGTDISSMFFFRFGPEFFHGLSQGSPGIVVDEPIRLADKDSHRIWLKWYTVPALNRSLFGVGNITGINLATAVTA